MAMIASRNRTSHTYNKATAEAIVQAVCYQYLPLLQQLCGQLEALKNDGIIRVK